MPQSMRRFFAVGFVLLPARPPPKSRGNNRLIIIHRLIQKINRYMQVQEGYFSRNKWTNNIDSPIFLKKKSLYSAHAAQAPPLPCRKGGKMAPEKTQSVFPGWRFCVLLAPGPKGRGSLLQKWWRKTGLSGCHTCAKLQKTSLFLLAVIQCYRTL